VSARPSWPQPTKKAGPFSALPVSFCSGGTVYDRNSLLSPTSPDPTGRPRRTTIRCRRILARRKDGLPVGRNFPCLILYFEQSGIIKRFSGRGQNFSIYSLSTFLSSLHPNPLPPPEGEGIKVAQAELGPIIAFPSSAWERVIKLCILGQLGSDLPLTCSRGLGRRRLPVHQEGHGERLAPSNFVHDPVMLFLHLGYEFLSSHQHPPDSAPERTGGGIRFGE
jgi:hypothetical protein